MRDHLFACERVIALSQSKRASRAGRRQRFEAEIGQQPRRSHVVRVGNDERARALMERLKSDRLL